MAKKCVNHPDAPAVADCVVCGTPACLMCVEEVGDNNYCSGACAATHRQKSTQVPGKTTRIGQKPCHAHPAADAVASCKVCQKAVCGLCVVDVPEGEFCSAQCQQDFASVDGWVTPASGSASDIAAAGMSTTDQLLISGEESILDLGAVRRPPPKPEPAPESLEEVVPYKPAENEPPLTYGPPEEEEPAPSAAEAYLNDATIQLRPDEAKAPPPPPPPPPPPMARPRSVQYVSCMTCAKQLEKSSAIETSEGNLFCSFECSGQQMGVPREEEAPASSFAESEEETEAKAPSQGSKSHFAGILVAIVLLGVVGVVAWQALKTPAPAAGGASAKADPSKPLVPPKPAPKPDPKPEPVKAKPEPVTPKPEPKPEPVKPKPEPVKPKPEPKPEPVKPKPEPKPEPVKPRPEPLPPKKLDPKRLARLLAEAGRLMQEAEPRFKEVVDDRRPEAREKARALASQLSRARDLYTACRESDPAALDRKVSSIAVMMDALR